jgi:hypothetical protein
LHTPQWNPERHSIHIPFSLRAHQFSTVTTPPSIKLYQYHICPFCNITKSIFSYSNLEYEAVEVNPLTKAELKPW